MFHRQSGLLQAVAYPVEQRSKGLARRNGHQQAALAKAGYDLAGFVDRSAAKADFGRLESTKMALMIQLLFIGRSSLI
jgi:hypothetical protein